MDYSLALFAGKVSFSLIFLASGYYLLRSLFVLGASRGINAGLSKQLRSLVTHARLSHPYLAGIIPLAALYHVAAMWLNHGLGIKSGLGAATAVMVAVMLLLGIKLKLQPAHIMIRLAHRRGALLIIILAVAHRMA